MDREILKFKTHGGVLMTIVKMIAMIFLAIYLILTGLAAMSDITLSHLAKNVIDLLAISSGVLILISIGRCIPHKE